MVDCTKQSYYKMRKLKRTPAETRIPGYSRVMFSIDEVDRWLTANENPSKADAIAIAKQKAAQKLNSDIANAHKQRQEA